MISVDLRTKIFVFLCTTFLVAILSRDGVFHLFNVFLVFYLLCTGYGRQGAKCLVVLFSVLLLREVLGREGLTVLLPDMFLFMLTRTLSVLMSVIPILNVPPGEIVASLKKLRISQSFSLPLIFMMRFFPVIRQEFQDVFSALKLRGLYSWRHPLTMMNYLFVPVIFSSSRTADELAAAAEVRGLSYPGRHTSRREIEFSVADGVVAMLSLVAVVFLLYLEGKLTS